MYDLDGKRIPIARHADIADRMAEGHHEAGGGEVGKGLVEGMIEYQATARRDGRFGVIDIPDIGVTQARTTAEAELMARDHVAVVLEVPDNSFAVSRHFVAPSSVEEHLKGAEELRRLSADAQSEAAAEVRLAAVELRDAGLGLRDIGRMMGVSYQRAGQLVS